jgi:hypothetical protein
VLTASWIKEKALDLWDMRNCSKKISNLKVKTNASESNSRSTSAKTDKDGKNGEYLYACKFFSISDYIPIEPDNVPKTPAPSPRMRRSVDSTPLVKQKSQNSFSTVLACGSGTQSLHLIDYEQKSIDKMHLAAIHCASPLYCLDAMYSSSLIACGGMNNFYTMMASSSIPASSNPISDLGSTENSRNALYEFY